MKDNINVEVIKADKTGLFCNYIFKVIPLAFDESMSYYECLCGLLNYLKNTIIPTVNNNAEAVAELQELFTKLQNFVNNYFDNLDVQDEINNKLDEMVKDGTFENILTNYSNITRVYNTHQDLVNDANALVNNMKVKTLGYYEINDGGGAEYYITDTLDETKYQEKVNDLYAELIIKDSLNVKQLGAYGDGIHDDSLSIEKALKFKNVFINNGIYLITKKIEVKSEVIIGESKNAIIKIISNPLTNIDTCPGLRFSNSKNITIKNLCFDDGYEDKSRFSYNINFTNSQNILIDNIEVKNNCGVGLFFLNCSLVKILNSKIHDCEADGIHIQRGSKNFIIENCEIYNTKDDCIGFISHEAENYGQCKNLIVKNCILHDTITTGSGICCDGSLDVIISDNNIYNTQLGGIRSNRFKESGSSIWFYPKNIIILNNIIENVGLLNNNKSAIISNQGSSMNIIGNTIKNTIDGINCLGVLGEFNISNNIIDNITTNNGITITASNNTNQANNFIININNNILNNIGSIGIFVTDNNTSNIIDDNISVIIRNNIMCKLNSLNQENKSGISANSTRNLKLIGNIIQNSTLHLPFEINNTPNHETINNFPIVLNQTYTRIGTSIHSYGGSAPTTGNKGDVIWNWNPDNGIACWVCTVSSTNSSNAVYKEVGFKN